MRVALCSTYDLGRQPFGLAEPAAWLRRAGFPVACHDLAREPKGEAALATADLVAFHLPMHTATRLAVAVARRLRAARAGLPLLFYGLYAPRCAATLEALAPPVVVIGGEVEQALVEAVTGLAAGAAPPSPRTLLERLTLLTPDRRDLPPLACYPALRLPDGSARVVGYTEASRGCKHRCRHCPVVPVYDGRVRLIDAAVVGADIAQQVAAGAQHITFGDPDFFNAPDHALAIARNLAAAHPGLTFDATIKVSHLLAHPRAVAELAACGCLFITSAFESFEATVLDRLAKQHTVADLAAAVAVGRRVGVTITPTFVPFTPWTTLAGVVALFEQVAALDLVAAVAPVQYTLRLLLPPGSLLLDDPACARLAGPLDEGALVHPWRHPQPALDRLQRRLTEAVVAGSRAGFSRPLLYARLRALVEEAAGRGGSEPVRQARTAVPFLEEPWFC
ncbi:MAG: radical SAM protein [Nitrospirae bacterium CG18_big_fil_WC_8_21_14_2_50_70_55]|nr:radical SAM protein [Deltaproteobacteria bacterium]OIP67823.1 MAG: hypothetical protein AUK30_00240 [Nitrospirae bacterium CG2_30_70_394]PIQ07071.1 MAG: radical SAM protein [Nitrospirae bacterium CG18_big_fil_WC_8_21_14_2_50_70_55]PIU78874.1 MAG: radical SAM protein [Nitrospirae bacterium CG06_land_8_20_14_3_00_70_43]PIW82375.1 MAG: radical SAM protein [Nitrospirae bacterium CG_4_8_14_3_um_filter_70_85]PIX82385.1 MAG: radical SAM protein [Nitrospirae bacterium CG_4_10_14_3_um_filter_70_108]